MNSYDDRYNQRNDAAERHSAELDPRERQYTGQYAGRYTGQLTGQIPRLDPRDLEQGDFNPLDYYKGEGPSPAERRQYQQEQVRRRPAERRPRPDHARARQQRGSRANSLDLQYTLGRVGADFKNILQRIFGVRPESVFRAELSWVTRAILLFVNILLSGLFVLAGGHFLDAMMKKAVGEDTAGLLKNLVTNEGGSLLGGTGGWSLFGAHLLYTLLNLLFLGAGLVAIFRLLQREPRSAELSINTLSIASLMQSAGMVLILLLSLIYKPLYFAIGHWALFPLYFNIAIGFNELNRENRRSGYWLLGVLILCSLLLLNLLPQVLTF